MEAAYRLKNGTYSLRATKDKKTQELSLRTKDEKTAKSRTNRFNATWEKFGYEAACEELMGKPIVKSGGNPTFEEIEQLYKEYCAQTVKAPRPHVQDRNLKRLKFIMAKMNAVTVIDIDQSKIHPCWFRDIPKPTPSQERTFSSAISTASGVFKKAAIKFYESKGNPIKNPFQGFDGLKKPKVKQYVPLPEALRQDIWNHCQTELKPCETMIVLMALGIGMRISEINAAIPAWFSKQSDKVIVHVREEEFFAPKAGEDGLVPVALDLYEMLLKLRGDSPSKWFVPFKDDEYHPNRLRKRFEAVNAWLKGKGVTDRKPLHALRKECGSLVARRFGILEASKVLRNTPQVCAIHYAGIAELNTVDIGGTMKAPDPKDKLQAAADLLGVSLKEMKQKMGMS